MARRPAFITLVFLSLMALVATEGFVVFRFLKNAADATKLVDLERRLAHDASGLTRKVMSESRVRETSVAFQDDEEYETSGADVRAATPRSLSR